MSRLAAGGLIDRSRPLSFVFDRKGYCGFEGDTLASALVANDVRLVGRSFKYHRPRGILTAGGEEPNALVTLRSGAYAEPNTRATTVSLFDGLEASSQNRWPSLDFDVLAINQLFAPILVAGFYYKTFMWPARLWEKVYEPMIRRAAGLGKLSMLPDPDSYDRDHGFCDLLVIGGGPSGLSAALTAGRAGLRVFLVDEDARFGGRLLSERYEVGEVSGVTWADQTVAELLALPNVRLLPRTSMFGVYDGLEYVAVERVSDHLPSPAQGQPRQRLWKIIAKRTILATGAIERPLIFAGNDRPGVMLASAVSAYVNRYAALPGRRAVVFTASDSGWSTAADLVAAGAEVAAVVDVRDTVPPTPESLDRAGVEILGGARIRGVKGAPVRKAYVQLSDGRIQTIACDLVAMAGGWNPAIGLGSNLGAKPVWSDVAQSFLLGETPPGLTAAGAAAGNFSLTAALAQGASAAAAIAQEFGHSTSASQVPPARSEKVDSILWRGPSDAGKAFVDFQNDVTDRDVRLAALEGFISIEHMKRYTTLGMATDQGKTSQLNGHALLAAATGKSIAEAGTIMSRPPYQPVSIGALAGFHRDEHFRPERRTSSHDWAAAQGAVFVDAGQWKRAQWFARPDERDWVETVNREVLTTRSRVGICDVSTLGKIELHGPDAATLLDRLYINTFSTLPVGKARYGVMLREDGIVMDDGTTTRFAEESYFLTTTTANAAKVMQHIDYALQVLWPALDVQATSVTEQWATFAVAGPLSRVLLQQAFSDIDLSNEAFPYMAAASFTWLGIGARIYRLSFSGELAYEVSVPAFYGESLLRHLFEIGRAFDVAAYGTEALGVMRIEKGHPAGNELNGTTTAADLGLGTMMSKRKDFIGRIMATRSGLNDPRRPTLVGLKTRGAKHRLRAGAHLFAPGAALTPANDEGYITSSAWSPTLECSIALALLTNGTERKGERIAVHDPVRGGNFFAEVCDPVFVDPEGVRVRG